MLIKQLSAESGGQESARRGVLSEPIENLIQDEPCGPVTIKDGDKEWPVHVLIVGSGYGGAIAAMRLAAQNQHVVVLERGGEYATGNFPQTIQELPAHVQILPQNRDLPIGYPHALFDFRLGNPVSVLVGCGLGGGSLINANVAMEPEDDLFNDPRWPSNLLSRELLQPHFKAVRHLLGVTEYRGARKFDALERVFESLGAGATCEPAPIAVTTHGGPNAVDISQNPCIGCGNCVTGCNYGSKNTLPMNALPLAKSRGARLYTGATVLSIEPDGAPDGSGGWLVRFRRTDTTKTVLHREVFTLRARAVILAAGTLGSTEILLRSSELGRVHVSRRLGERFSTNGDALAFGYAQKHEINAAAQASQPPDQRNIGPTITGVIRANAGNGNRPRVTVEDGAVPSALAHVFGEVLATAAAFKRNSKLRLPAWFRTWANRIEGGRYRDPLAVHHGAIRYSQVLLVMGDDEAGGRLELEQREGDAPVDPDRSRVRICEPSEDEPPAGEPPVFGAVDRLFEQAEKRGGFDGGDYLPNPFWKVLPAELSQASNLPPPGRNLLSVHPLGGCPMGRDVRSGVVNHHGQVFRRGGSTDRSLYKGLYVMDGSIMPCALGVNPFLTIAALAHRNAEEVAGYLGWKVQGIGAVPQNVRQVVEATLQNPSLNPVPDLPVGGHFEEFLTGRLSVDPASLEWVTASFGEDAARLFTREQEGGLVLRARIDAPDVMGWLREPNKSLGATATLFANRGGINPVREELFVEPGFRGEGRVEWLAWDRPCCCVHRLWRGLRAVCAFIERRRGGSFFWKFLKSLNWREPWNAFKQLVKAMRGFFYVAVNAANWRYLSYIFTFQTNAGMVELSGTKELAYTLSHRDPWTALTELPFTLRPQRKGKSIKGTLQVDLDRLTRRSWFQADQSPDSPTTIAAMISACMMFLRIVFQTHFWSFGAPDYPENRIQPSMQLDTGDRPNQQREDETSEHEREIRLSRQPEPIRIENGDTIYPEPFELPVPMSREDEQTVIPLRLVRYRRDDPPSGTILLIHGLASGSRVFATNTIEENFATYFYRRGYDVWLLDYRVSIALPAWISEGQWDMDQIGRYDMSRAVRRVYEETDGPVQVFAHCVGAASLAMGILDGQCQDGQRSMISALALHAVAPWPVPSPVNRMKANLAALIRDALTWRTLDAVLPHRPSAFDVTMDRIAGSVPFPHPLKGDEADHRRHTDATNVGRNICDRMTLFYGWEWNHIRRPDPQNGEGPYKGGLSPQTHSKLAELVGVANFETFRHIYFLLTRKRLTTRLGEDTYVQERNFDLYWRFPTLFAHGRDNQLYDPRSAIASTLRLRALRRRAGRPRGPRYDVYWFEAAPCGHFDFLFGQDANVLVYPYLEAFFRQAREEPLIGQAQNKWNEIAQADPEVTRRDPYWGEFSKIPYRGPIIGWTRRDGGHIVLRIWIEPYRFSSTIPNGIVSTLPNRHIALPQRPGYPGTYWVYDVTLPADFSQDLLLDIDYPAEAQEITITLNPTRPDPPPEKLHDPKKGARIPLSTLPWFKQLREQRPPGRSAFLIGSCRYPGSPFDVNLADRVFGPMCGQVADSAAGPGVDHVLFVGDQIYADATADVFDTAELRERFAGHYREAFGAPNMQRLLASVPIYMALDDHEFGDNWTGDDGEAFPNDSIVRKFRENFEHGFTAAIAYQWSMSSRNKEPRDPRKDHPETDMDGLWYGFDSGGLPFFVMDTRTERALRRAGIFWGSDRAHIVDIRQLEALENWLLEQPRDKPKFIVSGSVLAPVAKAFIEQPWLYRHNDGWAGYPATWKRLVKHIVKNQIQKVVFIAGDYHFSAVARLILSSDELRQREGKDAVTAHQIISSGLFAPLAFMNPRAQREYVWNGPAELPFSDGNARLVVEPELLCEHSSHFLRVDAEPGNNSNWTLNVGAYDCNGNRVRTVSRVV